MASPQIKLFNTLSGKKENLPRPENGVMRLFVCGPTVYDISHIGHARTYIVFDALVRYLRSRKIKTQYLQNITNIDDKIINRAAAEGIDPLSLSATYEAEYLADMKALGVNQVDIYARATDHLKDIYSQIARLLKNGYAYQTENGIYFEVKKFRSYGKLSRQNLNAVRPGWRIELDPHKKDPLDFALWKFIKTDNELSFPSPWGPGRPGWHIEDTAIAEKFFGLTYELHGGGMDLKFPHHEAEIAQARALSGARHFVKTWIHTGFLTVNGEKMSKSLNNYISIRDVLKSHTPEALRLVILGHHYRTPFDYSENLMEEAETSWDGILRLVMKLQKVAKTRSSISKKTKQNTIPKSSFDLLEKEFQAALADDFNTPSAIASLFEFLGRIRPNIWMLSAPSAKHALSAVTSCLKILGLEVKAPHIPSKIAELVESREKYRKKGHYKESDSLRKQILSLGFSVEDTPRGPFVWPEVRQ